MIWGLEKRFRRCVFWSIALWLWFPQVFYPIGKRNERFPSISSCTYLSWNAKKYDKDADVILTSYAILRNDLEKFQEEEWNVVVLDEAQAIKNPRS